jgi:2-oxo-4-hydroxy-4-carboxy-5-ureidoimidazoline decarboxylase
MTQGQAKPPLGLDEVNAMDEARFVSAPRRRVRATRRGSRGARSPQRPFASVDALHAAMVAVMNEAGDEEQLALLRAHPELTGKAAVAAIPHGRFEPRAAWRGPRSLLRRGSTRT